MATPVLPDDFLAPFTTLPTTATKIRFYYCIIVNLAALNYPDVIPQVWTHLWEHVCEPLSHEERFAVAQKVREALIKGCAIMGPAKAGTAIRTLGRCIPPELRDGEVRRAKETQEEASRRGHALHARIYARNPDFDMDATPAASPDYAFVVRDLLYGRVLSYDAILDDLDTGFVVVAALIGLDCQSQLRNHMKGLLLNGATRGEVEELRRVCVDFAGRLGVRFRRGVVEVPEVEGEERGG